MSASSYGSSSNQHNQHRAATNYVLYYYVQLLMNKDKLICKDNGNSNSNSASNAAYGSTIGNYNDGVGMQFSAMGSYQTGMSGMSGNTSAALGRESWSGGSYTSYAGGGAIGANNAITNDSIGNSSQSRGNGQSSNEANEMMHFARIIRLYYMVMYHIPLYSCLKILYAHLNPNNPNKSALYNVIRDLCSKPRTLKQMSRVIIYNAVGQRPALTVNKLPLPTALREYVLSFEP